MLPRVEIATIAERTIFTWIQSLTAFSLGWVSFWLWIIFCRHLGSACVCWAPHGGFFSSISLGSVPRTNHYPLRGWTSWGFPSLFRATILYRDNPIASLSIFLHGVFLILISHPPSFSPLGFVRFIQTPRILVCITSSSTFSAVPRQITCRTYYS